ncbi:MAG TPA: polysaccharide biosynthesis/export family protein [Candidatus Binatia bacterium]|nr:polysaccharide biosynthesis/export family protein [Candidatus Binatia bacterium]
MGYQKKRLIALVLGILLTGACGPVSQSPESIAKRSNELPGGSSSATFAAGINSNIAAAALLSSSASSDYRIGPEDLLEITLFNIPQAYGMESQVTPRSLTVRVTHQGQISLPLAGELDVRGLTVSGLEKKIREAYDKYIYNPQVGVLIKEFRQRASVIGAVQKPGVFELTGPKSVIELLAMAGGVSEKAGSQVHIYRQREKERETHVIDLAVLANNTGLINANNAAMINMPVEPGDMINVPEAGMFFVDGAVHKRGSYPLGRRYTLSQALATAGGVDAELNTNEISILRRRGAGDIETIALNLDAVMSGSVPDPQIQPDDVIVVPTSTAKYLVKRFVGSLIGGVSIGGLVGGS